MTRTRTRTASSVRAAATKKRAAPVPAAATGPVRRSARNVDKSVDYKESTLELPRASPPSPPAVPRKRQRAAASQKAPIAVDPGSCRAHSVDLQRVAEELVGTTFEDTGKATVMQTICSVRRAPRYNKYSGVLEWDNAVMLWVNVGGQDYGNFFLEKGRKMTWYGGKSHYEDSPVIRRLLPAEKGGSAAPVLLFCRAPHAMKKSQQTPYLCCGQLEYVSHDPDARPLQFVWKLKDWARVAEAALFQRMLSIKRVAKA